MTHSEILIEEDGGGSNYIHTICHVAPHWIAHLTNKI